MVKESIDETLFSMPVNKRHTLVPASYLVLKRNNEVLLSRRFQTGYEDGKYSVPAGHVEEGETCTRALIREIEEEIGIGIDIDVVRLVHVMHRKSADSERVDFFFMVEIWQGDIQNKEPGKCDDLSWFPLDRLPESIIPYVRQALEDIQGGVIYSEFGFER